MGDLGLFDMSNYPKSLDSNVHYKNLGPMSKLLGRNPSSQSKKNLLDFKYAGYDNDFMINKEKITSFLQLDFESIFIVYQQQPIMRIIDYSMAQITYLIIQPEMLTMYANSPNPSGTTTTTTRRTTSRGSFGAKWRRSSSISRFPHFWTFK